MDSSVCIKCSKSSATLFPCTKCKEKYCEKCSRENLRFSKEVTCEKCYNPIKCKCNRNVPWKHAFHFRFELYSQYANYFEKEEHGHCSNECFLDYLKSIVPSTISDIWEYWEYARTYSMRKEN